MKPINITTAVTFNPTGTATGANIANSNSSYPYSNGYNGTSNTSSYARLQLNANSTTTDCYIYYTFSISDIPSNATINSVSCVARIYANNRVTTGTSTNAASIQLYNGTTAKGSQQTGIGRTAANVTISNTGSWTVSELNNIRLRIKGRRSGTNNTSYIYFYGADLTINYTVNDTAYEVNVVNNSEASVSPSYFSGSGEDCVITFTGIEDSSDIIVKDNGTTVTLSPHYIEPLTVNPSQLIDSNGNTGNIEEGLTDTSSSTYAYTNGQYNHYLLYGFDLSMIPQNAVINSVSCAAKVQHTRTTASGEIQLYAGSTAKGSVSTFGNTASTVNLTTGTWTRSELNDIRIRIGNNYDGGTTTYQTRFYGANLTVNYSVPGVTVDYYTYTISNISADHNIVVEDAVTTKYTVNASSTYNGATVSPSTQEVREGRNATVTVSVQNLYEINITDNGVDIKNSLVGSNGTYTYSLTNVQTAHTISVTEATYYNLVASSSHDTATISPATMKVYQGQNAVFTINGNVSNLILKDNGIDVTSSISNGSYTITNVTAVHTLTVLNKPADFAKIDGSYRKVGKVFKKIEGVWVEINKTAFDDFVSTNIMMYGGDIRIEEIGSVETVGEIVNISINNNALSTGTYKLIYEDEHREPLDNVDKITEFTI